MKFRHVDLYFDDFIAGVAGELTPAEMGVYSMVILLCYSHGGSIPDDLDWLRGKFKRDGSARGIGPAIEQLVKLGKLERANAELSASRVRAECERALSRVRASAEHGARGGRPPKNINGVDKGSGSPRARVHPTVKQTAGEQVKERARAAPRSPIPPDWQPDAAGRAYALQRAGWLGDQIDHETAHFRNHHQRNGSLFADHAAAWRTWVDQGAKFQGRTNGRDRHTEGQQQHARALDILAQAAIDFDERQGRGGPAEAAD